MADIEEIKAYIEKLQKKEQEGEDIQELWELMNSDFEKFKIAYSKRFHEKEIQKTKMDEQIDEVKKELLKEEKGMPKSEIGQNEEEPTMATKKEIIKEEIREIGEEIKREKEKRILKEEKQIEENEKEIPKEEKKAIVEEQKTIEKKEIQKEEGKPISEEIKIDVEKKEEKAECVDEVVIQLKEEKVDVDKIWTEEKKEEKKEMKKVEKAKGEISNKEMIGLLIAVLGILGLVFTIIYKFIYGFTFGLRTQGAIIVSIVLLIGGVSLQFKFKYVFKNKDIFSSPQFRKIIVIAIVLILIFSVVNITNYYFMNIEPTPIIEIKHNGKETNEIMVGEILTFNAEKSYDKDGYLIQFKGEIVNYTWDFGDGTRSYDKKTEYYYLKDGYKTVKLTVRDNKGVEKTVSKNIYIKPLVLTVPNKKIGDVGNYLVSGSVGVWNNDTGLIVQKVEGGKIIIKSVSLTLGGTLDIDLKRIVDKEDALKNSHKTLEVLLIQKVSFSGKSIADFKSDSVFPPSQNNIEIQTNGNSNVDDAAYIDLQNNKTIQKNTTSDLSISFTYRPFPTYTEKSSDNIISYAKLSELQFNFEEIYANRKFDFNNPNTLSFEIDKKGTTYNLTTQTIEKIKNYTTLKIKMTIDEQTMQKKGFAEYFAEFWISKEFSYPLKVGVYGKGIEPSTNAEFLFDITTTNKEFQKGTAQINFKQCNAEHYKTSKEEFKNWTFFPEGNGSFAFSPSEAIEMALNEINNATANFRNYVRNTTRNESYVVFSNYTEENNQQRWNFTFGTKDSTNIYNLTVIKEGENFTFEDKGISWMNSPSSIFFIQSKDLFFPTKSKFNLRLEMLTIDAFENILKNDTKAKEKIIFNNGKIDYSKYFFETRVDLPYQFIDINALFSEADKSSYGYLLKSKDGSFAVAVDGETGYLMYVIEHA